jgi:hypothetical protein
MSDPSRKMSQKTDVNLPVATGFVATANFAIYEIVFGIAEKKDGEGKPYSEIVMERTKEVVSPNIAPLRDDVNKSMKGDPTKFEEISAKTLAAIAKNIVEKSVILVDGSRRRDDKSGAEKNDDRL